MKASIKTRQKPQRHKDTKGTGAIEDDSGTDIEIKRRISMSVPRLLRPPLCLCVFVVPVISVRNSEMYYLVSRNDILRGAGKYSAAVGKCDVAARTVVGAIFGPEPFDLDNITDF